MMLTLPLLTLLSVSVLAETKTQCHFYGDQQIEKITITSSKSFPFQNIPSTKGHVEITYIDGSVERLAPQSLVEGSFGEVVYPDSILSWKIKPHQRSLVYVNSGNLGDVKISYTCGHKYSDIFCNPRGGGISGAIADFNIDGISYSFKQDNNDCSFRYL